MNSPVITDRELSDVFTGVAETTQDLANPAPEKNPTLRDRNTQHDPKMGVENPYQDKRSKSSYTAELRLFQNPSQYVRVKPDRSSKHPTRG
jgi:hypothetical protein